MLVACERDGEVMGFGSGTIRNERAEAELETLYPLRRAQGHGDGRRLMAELTRRLQKLGAMALILGMAHGNRPPGATSAWEGPPPRW